MFYLAKCKQTDATVSRGSDNTPTTAWDCICLSFGKVSRKSEELRGRLQQIKEKPESSKQKSPSPIVVQLSDFKVVFASTCSMTKLLVM